MNDGGITADGGVRLLALRRLIRTWQPGTESLQWLVGGPTNRISPWALALNGGRVLGYTLAGVIVGAFGGGLLAIARVDGLATALRVAMGAVLVLAGLRLLWPHRFGFLNRGGAMAWRWLPSCAGATRSCRCCSARAM